MQYRVNGPQVISETAGEETIIVNLASGHYFNLQGSAVDVWAGVEAHESRSTIVAALVGRYDVERAEAEAAVASLLDQLLEAGLICSNGEGPDEPAETAPVAAAGQRAPFVPPSLVTYTDMEDIILLDPVHEVDDRGWPHVAPEPASAPGLGESG